MQDSQIPEGTIIRLLYDTPSQSIAHEIIPEGTRGTIIDAERHHRTLEIVGYYATMHWWFDDYMYLDPWDFEIDT